MSVLVLYMVKYENDQKAAMLKNPNTQDRAAAHRQAIADFGGKPIAQYGSYGEYDMIYIYEMPNDKALAANLHLTDSYGLAKYSKAIPLMSSDDLAASLQLAEEQLTKVGMIERIDYYPSQLSGGQKQRVAIARALAMKPSVLLMDEPFGALDALTRAHLQDSLMEIQQELNNTVIMITHDVDEAVLLSDRIIMMTNGPAATVGEDLHIDLPRPRNRVALADDAKYVHYRQEVLSFLYEKQRKLESLSSRRAASASTQGGESAKVEKEKQPASA